MTYFDLSKLKCRKLARWYCVEKITHAILGLFQETMAYKQAFHACSATPDSFFYAYSAVVDTVIS